MNWVLWLSISDGLTSAKELMVRPSEGGSKMKGRGLVLHEPARPRAALSLPTAGHRDRAGGPQRGPADIRSPRNLPADRHCCGASPLGSQGTCLGLAAGSAGMESRLGALPLLMVSAGHTDTYGDTNTDKCHVQTWTCLCLRAPTGTETQRGGRHIGPSSPSQGILAAPLKKPQPHPPHKLVQQKTSTTLLGSRAALGPCRQRGAGCYLPAINLQPNLSQSCSKACIREGIIPSLCSSISHQAVLPVPVCDVDG